MADKPDDNMLGMSSTQRLTMDVAGLMLKGAAYAALLVIAIWAFIYVFVIISWFLPEESQNAADPTPLSFQMEAPPSLPLA
ncbi:MAG: RC-LH1 core complex protein PufX [Pseudomonadota bacterium]